MNYQIYVALKTKQSYYLVCSYPLFLNLVFIICYNYCFKIVALKDCEKCKKYEETLIQIREELVDSLSAWVVKVEGSNLVHIYNPSKEPTLVMFRHGVPLLITDSGSYDYQRLILVDIDYIFLIADATNDELLIDILLNNRDPIVKELNDNNFEHLTQASTGATTGDWLIKL